MISKRGLVLCGSILLVHCTAKEETSLRTKAAPAGAIDDEDVASEEAPGAAVQTVESSNLNLTVHTAEARPVPIEILVRNMGQRFNVTWLAPRDCGAVPNYRQCSSVAYCIAVNTHLDKLYCGLGGEAREMSSYVGTNLSAGDLVLLWQFALNVCALKNGAGGSETADRLGATMGKSLRGIAGELVSGFLDYPVDTPAYTDEKEFILVNLFDVKNNEDRSFAGATADERNLDQLNKFGAACLYLTMHSKLVSY